ncbi:MAG: YfiM family protein [Bacteroidetes bacterium]|nr:YfiM family protein [Bacteroidota bacterium]
MPDMKGFGVFCLIFLMVFRANAESMETLQTADSTIVARPNYRKLHAMFAAQSVLYAGSLYALSKTWYKNPLTRFSIADDTHEWLQIDKVGHLYTSYQISRHTVELYKKTGISKKQALIYGAISGFFFQTPIELLDGFSPDYGFSSGDVVANLAGPALYLGQYALWDEVRIHPKFSFHYTPLASVRPELLGSNYSERWLKDYNGQTYWFSASPRSFAPSSGWPAWLCLSVGYGIQDMVAGETGKSVALGYSPYRQYYLSVDIDFTKIKTHSKFVRTVAFMLNTLKIPAPAVSFSRKGVAFRPFYF